MDEPRIGIRICDCKGLVSDHLDTARVEQAAGQLQGVVHLARTDHLCAPHQLAELEQSLRDVGVRRLLFAGCSARSSLKFPQQRLNAILQRLGIDKALLEVANLREQCAWLHKDREAATCKGMDQLRMAHARLIHDQACLSPAPLERRSLVIGGGPAGLQAARSLASAGLPVTLVEQASYLGGRLCQMGFLFQCESWQSYCRSECVGPVQAKDIVLDPGIQVLTRSQVLGLEKMDGNFQARIERGAAFVDPELCISCGRCADVCPESVQHDFAQGHGSRKAIDKDFERAVPDAFNIVDAACTRCGDCLPVCPSGAIDLQAKPHILEQRFGAVFLATGFEHHDLDEHPSYGQGSPNAVSSLEFERVMEGGVRRPSDGEEVERICFALCAGSRTRRNGVSYCSKTCCSVAIKQAERIVAANPMAEVIILYNGHIRTYERALEATYQHLENMGVEFVNGEIEEVEQLEDGRLRVNMALAEGQGELLEDADLEDAQLDDDELALDTDILVLSAPQVPRRAAAPLLQQLGVLADPHGFPMENQVRMFRPTESMVDRVYAVGASVGPKVIQQAVEQGSAGAMKALPLLLKGEKELGKHISQLDQERCIRCRTCMAVCPHGAIRMTEQGAVSDPAFCQSCGFCAAACPTHAAQLVNFTDQQILAQAAAAFGELPAGEPRILALLCYWCSYGGGDMAGVSGMEAPANFRSIRIRCSSSVNSGLIMQLLRMGVDGLLVSGCPEKNCHHAWGNYLSDRRIVLLRKLLDELGVAQQRLRFEYIGVPQGQKLVDTLAQMDEQLRALGPNPIPALQRSPTHV